MEKINYNDEDVKDHHAAAAVIKNAEGRFLMQEHAKYGFWTLPVGKVVKGQEIEDGLKEEVFEECNLVIEECSEIDSLEREYERRGKPVRVIEHLFEVEKYSGNLENKEPHKHLQQKFVDLEEIKRFSFLSNFTLMFLKTLGFERQAKI